MALAHKITPFLWFENQAEEAARFYTGIFKNSRIKTVTRYGEAGKQVHRRPPGSAMTVEFELEGQPFTALNGGPDPGRSARVTQAMLRMKKIDIAALEQAAA